MNKKTRILLLVLLILVFITLFRWDDSKWESTPNYIINMKYDRLTSLSQYTVLSPREKRTVYENRFVTIATNTGLNLCMLGIGIALLLEARKKE